MLIIARNVLLVVLLIMVLAVIIFTIKFYRDRNSVESEELLQVSKMTNIGSVKSLSILPLIESETKGEHLTGEPGVSYLIKVDEKYILYDMGWNGSGQHPSPLLRNMDQLNVNVGQIDQIFISHPHPDHTGGKGLKGSFALSGQEIDLEGISAYTSVEMEHPSAVVEDIDRPTRLDEGIVSTGPLSRAIWLLGIVQEQSLAINLEGKGIVLIVGCGHPSIEKIIKRAETIFDQPIYGVIGGLHYPITNPLNLQSIAQKVCGPKLPWQGYEKQEVKDAIQMLKTKGIKVVGISPHDSCDWTISQFKENFGDGYQEILVGEEIVF